LSTTGLAGCAFYLRTGKRMPERVSAITIQFRPAPHNRFRSTAALDWHHNAGHADPPRRGSCCGSRPSNRDAHAADPVDMSFCYQRPSRARRGEAYETLLLDVMLGDATLFMRADQVERAWSSSIRS